MARLITLKYPATCEDCGAQLKKGQEARYYGFGRVYGASCHEQNKPVTKRKRRNKSSKADNRPNSEWSHVAVTPNFVLEIGAASDSALRFESPASGTVIVRFNPINQHAAKMLKNGPAVARVYIESLYVDAVVAIMLNKRSRQFNPENFFTVRDYVLRSMNQLDIENKIEKLIYQISEQKIESS